MGEEKEITRADIANMSAEELDKIKKDVVEEVLNNETPAEEAPEAPDKPEAVAEETTPTETPDPAAEETPAEEVTKPEGEVDYSKLSQEELVDLVKKQNKRLTDKDSFIKTLESDNFRTREEKRKLKDSIAELHRAIEKKKAERPSKEELNREFAEDPVGTQEKIDKIKKEDAQDEAALIENVRAEKRLSNQELMLSVDEQTGMRFEELIPEVKEILKATGKFPDSAIEAFAKDPYLEDFEILMDLRSRAVKAKNGKTNKPKEQPKKPAEGNDTNANADISKQKKEDLADKINRAARKTTPVMGSGTKSEESKVASNLRQTSTGKYDLSSLSKEELDKLKAELARKN